MANFNELNNTTNTTSTQNDVSDSLFKTAEVGGAKHNFYKDKSGRLYYVMNGKKIYADPGSTLYNHVMSYKAPSGSGSGSGVKTTTTSSTAVQNAYLQQLEAQRQRQEELARQRQQIAQDAYDRNKAAYENAFAERKATLDNNLASTMNELKADYDASKGNINTDSANSLREAYVNYMNNRKNLNQALSAQGITGGAAESTIAGLGNTYGNARNNIDVATLDNLSNLERLYNQNRNEANQNYSNQLASDALAKANYMTQLESDLANSIAQAYTDRINALSNIDDSYYSTMAQLAAAQQSYTPIATAANNGVDAVTAYQADSNVEPYEGANPEAGVRVDPADVARLRSAYNYARSLMEGGATAGTVAGLLSNRGSGMSLNGEQIAYILNQLGMEA